MKEKILFLDIDGVLNGEEQFETPICFSKEAVETLKQLIKEHQAKIVITSSWQGHDGSSREKLKKIFEKEGLEIFDFINPSENYLNTDFSPRSCGILDYLQEHPCSYLILDDEYQQEYEFLHLNYYHTPTLVGLKRQDLPHLSFKQLDQNSLFSSSETKKIYTKRK